MLKAAVILSSFSLLACASAARGSRCSPIDPEAYLDYGGLYDECTVEQSARVSFAPRIEYLYRPQRGITCVFAELRVIVDTTGKPLPETVEIVHGNDARYVELMVSFLPQVRFSPARVKGRAVHQIARWESRTAVRDPGSASGAMQSRSDPC